MGKSDRQCIFGTMNWSEEGVDTTVVVQVNQGASKPSHVEDVWIFAAVRIVRGVEKRIIYDMRSS